MGITFLTCSKEQREENMNLTSLKRKAAFKTTEVFKGSERDYFYRTTPRSYEDHTGLLRSFYEKIYNSAESLSHLKQIPDPAFEKKFFIYSFRVSENHAFWTVERKLGLDERIIDNVPLNERQSILVNNLKKYPNEFIDFAHLRINTINEVNKIKVDKNSLIGNEFYQFLLTGEPKKLFNEFH